MTRFKNYKFIINVKNSTMWIYILNFIFRIIFNFFLHFDFLIYHLQCGIMLWVTKIHTKFSSILWVCVCTKLIIMMTESRNYFVRGLKMPFHLLFQINGILYEMKIKVMMRWGERERGWFFLKKAHEIGKGWKWNEECKRGRTIYSLQKHDPF